MGRILEALTKAGPRTPPRPDDTPTQANGSGVSARLDPEMATDSPFIEVGGPRSQIEASTSVWTAAGGYPSAMPPPSANVPPIAPSPPSTSRCAAVVGDLLGVAYQPSSRSAEPA